MYWSEIYRYFYLWYMTWNDDIRHSYVLFFGRIVGVRANSKVTKLSLNALQYTFGEFEIVSIPLFFISCRSNIPGIQSHNDRDSAMELTSVVLRNIWVCSLYSQIIGQIAYIIVYPVQDFAVLTSSWAVVLCQFLLIPKSA